MKARTNCQTSERGHPDRLARLAITIALFLPAAIWVGEAWHPVGWLIAAAMAAALVAVTIAIGSRRRSGTTLDEV